MHKEYSRSQGGGASSRERQDGAEMKLCIRIVEDNRGGYTGVCPSLPGCMSRGQTREQAKKKLDEAIRGYLAAVGNCTTETQAHEVVEMS
jgi:predicted RNase H-like HicB family nuclease